MLSIVRQLQYILGKQVGQNEKIFVIDGQLLLKKCFMPILITVTINSVLLKKLVQK